MTLMKKIGLGLALALGLSLNAFAAPITVSPGDEILSGNQTSQSGIDDALAAFFDPDPVPDELYKDNEGGVEEGPLAGSYETTYNADLSGGTIEYVGGEFVGPVAYLLVKDGAATPAWYFFNLTDLGWDGVSTITLSGFWVGVTGAISHVTLYGNTGTTTVPEPATLALLGLGLLGIGLARRRRS